MKKAEEMTFAEVLAAELGPYPTLTDGRYDADAWARREALATAKEHAEDELAYARVLARSLRKPDADWPPTIDEPRRKVWREEMWARICEAVAAIKSVNAKDLGAERAREVRHELRRASDMSALLLEEFAAIEGAKTGAPTTGPRFPVLTPEQERTVDAVAARVRATAAGAL